MKRTWSILWAARFISRWEGFRSCTYDDGTGVATIGYGHTGPEARWGNCISRAKALRLLARDIRTAANAVNRAVHVKLTVRQRMALISLAFNIGAGAFRDSTLVFVLNRGKFKAAADQFLRWNKAGSPPVELLGLTRRRRAERRMFLNRKKH